MSEERKTRVRFAPSPTGYLHLGNARTALFNWLFARKRDGDFILRIEDTDQRRSTKAYEESLLRDLRWLKLDWDEGPDTGGAYGPYRQSSRMKLYRNYAHQLVKDGAAYPCFCPPEETDARREEMSSRGEPYRYDGCCRKLSPSRRRALADRGLKPALRFKVRPGEVSVRDLVRGEVKFDSSLLGDFVIMRPDDRPAFNFAVVLDDGLMEITHVIRGEDHLPNTPRQLLLYEALGLPPPRFAHLSLVMSPERKPLSKRRGDYSIHSFQTRGYLPEAVANYLALLGWSPPGREEIFSLKQMVGKFSLEALSPSSAIFDQTKLDWVANSHIRLQDPQRLTDLALPFLKKTGFTKDVVADKKYRWLQQVVETIRDEISCLSQVADYAPIFFQEESIPEEELAAELADDPRKIKMIVRLEESLAAAVPPVPANFWDKLFSRLQDDTGLDGKKLFPLLRLILTGRRRGPELKKILPLLPYELALKRARRAREMTGR